MNINDYFTKVKNLADVLTSIEAFINYEDLVAVILNGLGKYYSRFRTSIVVQETFLNFQDLIILLIREDMRIIGTSSNGGSQENAFYSNTNRGRSRGDKTSFQGQDKNLHGGHHQHKGQLHGGGRKNLKGKGSHGGCVGSNRGQRPNSDSNSYYYKKPRHMAKSLLSKGA
jgi:hypothetical protein